MLANTKTATEPQIQKRPPPAGASHSSQDRVRHTFRRRRSFCRSRRRRLQPRKAVPAQDHGASIHHTRPQISSARPRVSPVRGTVVEETSTARMCSRRRCADGFSTSQEAERTLRRCLADWTPTCRRTRTEAAAVTLTAPPDGLSPHSRRRRLPIRTDLRPQRE